MENSLEPSLIVLIIIFFISLIFFTKAIFGDEKKITKKMAKRMNDTATIGFLLSIILSLISKNINYHLCVLAMFSFVFVIISGICSLCWLFSEVKEING